MAEAFPWANIVMIKLKNKFGFQWSIESIKNVQKRCPN